MARRAGAETIEVDASHSIALSQPKAVADLLRTAVNATAAVGVALVVVLSGMSVGGTRGRPQMSGGR